MDGIADFFSFILSPVQMFLSETVGQLQSASNYVLSFLMTFLQGVMGVIQALLQLINIGNY